MFKSFVNFVKTVLTMYKKPSKFTDYEILKDYYGEEYIVLADGKYMTVHEAVRTYNNCYITAHKNVRVLRFYRG